MNSWWDALDDQRRAAIATVLDSPRGQHCRDYSDGDRGFAAWLLVADVTCAPVRSCCCRRSREDTFARVQLIYYSSDGYRSWDVEAMPAIAEGMPILVDDDLRFEDGVGQARATVVVNQWLRELPASGCPAPSSWAVYARALRDWMTFLAGRGVGLFDSRDPAAHPTAALQ